MNLRTLALLALPVALAAQSKLRPGLDPKANVLVKTFTVAPGAATEKWPAGQEVFIQKSTVERLKKERLFADVVDGSTAASAPEPAYELTGQVVQFDPGNRAARYAVGFGAGKTKLRVAFTLKDKSGKELFKSEAYGAFSGAIAFVGGDKNQAAVEAAGDVVDRLIKDLKKKN